MRGKVSLPRWCQCFSPTEDGKPPVSSAAKCATRAVICRAGFLSASAGVIVVYVLVTYVCLRALGVAGLANTTTPASEVMRHAFGSRGAKLIACGIAISTVGFLSQSILTAPRVYYAMARDGVFFKAVGTLSERTRVPVVAIILQGAWAAIVAMTGRYEQILNYVVTIDVLFFGLTGAALFIFRAQRTGDERKVCPSAVASDNDGRVRPGLLDAGHQHPGAFSAKRRDRGHNSWDRRFGLLFLGNASD